MSKSSDKIFSETAQGAGLRFCNHELDSTSKAYAINLIGGDDNEQRYCL
jgi:hypothetical protein